MRLIVTACTGHMGAIVCDLIEEGFENHTLILMAKLTALWIFPITKQSARSSITVSAAIFRL